MNQFSVTENQHTRRPDVVLFVNGLPLGVIELKNPADEDATVHTAWNQLQTYKAELPTLFAMNAALVVSDGIEARIGTLTGGWEWFKPWRTVTGEILAAEHVTELQAMLQGVFEPRRFLAMMRDFIVFEDDGGALAKKMAGYHQFHAVQVAVRETLRAAKLQTFSDAGRGRYEAGRRPGGEPGDRRIGVVWHTQGAGKSLTMAFYAGAIVRESAMQNPTIVVLTDRNDLDDQLFGTFRPLPGPVAPAAGAGGRPGRPAPQALGERRRRGVYHDSEILIPRRKATATPRYPTGATSWSSPTRPTAASTTSSTASPAICATRCPTPRSSASPERPSSCRTPIPGAVFGDYISIYDIRRSVEDRATVPIYYEGRLAKLELDESLRPRIDPGLRGGHRGRGDRAQGEAQDQVGAAGGGGRCGAAGEADRRGHRVPLRATVGGA